MTPALESIGRYVPVAPRLATGGQPDEAQLAALADAGFEVVINLALHGDPAYSLADATWQAFIAQALRELAA